MLKTSAINNVMAICLLKYRIYGELNPQFWGEKKKVFQEARFVFKMHTNSVSSDSE